jgi:hypothetical protein
LTHDAGSSEGEATEQPNDVIFPQENKGRRRRVHHI